MKKESFEDIISDILNNDKFNQLKYELHHGITRYDHSLRVARTTYKICNMLRIKKTNEIVRAAALHDFYTDSDLGKLKEKEKLIIHPLQASKNAIDLFNINEYQQNIIESHMFPLKGAKPNNIGSVIVTTSDKVVATYEMSRFKLALATNTMLILLFFWISKK